jgi:hypothetical protein
MSKTIASGVGLTNVWLAAQGVLSMKTLWAELAHLRSTAVCGPARSVVWGGCPAMGILSRLDSSFLCPKVKVPRNTRNTPKEYNSHPSFLFRVFRVVRG